MNMCLITFSSFFFFFSGKKLHFCLFKDMLQYYIFFNK
jgi:hypothetical protein